VRHNDDDRPLCAQLSDRLGQRHLAGTIHVRVRFIEHDQERGAIYGTSQRDALSFTAR